MTKRAGFCKILGNNRWLVGCRQAVRECICGKVAVMILMSWSSLCWVACEYICGKMGIYDRRKKAAKKSCRGNFRSE